MDKIYYPLEPVYLRLRGDDKSKENSLKDGLKSSKNADTIDADLKKHKIMTESMAKNTAEDKAEEELEKEK